MKRSACLLALSLFAALCGGAASAQDYPTRPVTIVLGLAAGTGLDMVARTYGDKLSQSLGRPVVFDNRPGAASIVAITALKNHPADGHALLVVTSGALAINRTAFKQLPYDPVKDFVPLSIYLKSPFILIVHPSLPAKSVPELIKFVKARPGQLTFSSSGLTGASRLSTELMSAIFGLQMTHVPDQEQPPVHHGRRSGQRAARVRGGRRHAVADPRRPAARARGLRADAAHHVPGNPDDGRGERPPGLRSGVLARAGRAFPPPRQRS